ncbi:MAG: 30S ribosomal protein S4 [Candidatus Bathyarchaeota archaeon]
MGDPKKQRKKFETPHHPWQERVIREELNPLGLYGLRNKRELWKHKTELARYRNIARSLLGMATEKRSKLETELLKKLCNLGLVDENASVDAVLDLTVQDILERRLQTQTFRLGLTKSPYQARQLIIHGHVSIGDGKITSPSYLVMHGEESEIKYSSDSPFSNPEHPIRKFIGPQQLAETVEISQGEEKSE